MDKKIDLKINNLTLEGVIENPDAKKLMILVHGFTGDWRGPDNIFEKLSKKLQKEDFAIIRFNFIGTPPSQGDFQDMTVATETEDLIKVIEYAKSLGYKEIGVLGESMAGTIVTKAYTTDLKVVIFWYPTFKFSEDFFANYLKEDAQTELKKNGHVLTDGFKVGKVFTSQITSVDVRNQVSKITSPVMFIHGDSDADVPHSQSEKAFQIANQPKELYIIKGADHCFRNEQDNVINLTADFLKRYF